MILSDAHWLRLLRRANTSEFGPEGRGPLEGLLTLSIRVWKHQDNLTPDLALEWLERYLDEREEGFVSGPQLHQIALACADIAGEEAPEPPDAEDLAWTIARRESTVRDADGTIGISDTEIIALLQGLTPWEEKHHYLDALLSTIENSAWEEDGRHGADTWLTEALPLWMWHGAITEGTPRTKSAHFPLLVALIVAMDQRIQSPSDRIMWEEMCEVLGA